MLKIHVQLLNSISKAWTWPKGLPFSSVKQWTNESSDLSYFYFINLHSITVIECHWISTLVCVPHCQQSASATFQTQLNAFFSQNVVFFLPFLSARVTSSLFLLNKSSIILLSISLFLSHLAYIIHLKSSWLPSPSLHFGRLSLSYNTSSSSDVWELGFCKSASYRWYFHLLAQTGYWEVLVIGDTHFIKHVKNKK